LEIVNSLTQEDVRVLGALIEKAIATPDNYPLSLNGLMTACNQASNREPVVAYDEATVSEAIDRLRREGLVRAVHKSDSRVTKYQHLAAEKLGLATRELAVLDILMLRGPQTAGEIRTRGSRLAEFDTPSDVETILEMLADRQPPLVLKLERRPGQKEARFAHLLSGSVIDVPTPAPERAAAARELGPAVDRVGALEAEVAEMRREIADLRSQLEAFRKQFE
jgi:uncharacterized protein YceH (UPF0502 family)